MLCMPLLSFMGEHPVLTVLLTLIIGETIRRSVQYARGIPDGPDKCPKCNYRLNGQDDEEEP